MILKKTSSALKFQLQLSDDPKGQHVSNCLLLICLIYSSKFLGKMNQDEIDASDDNIKMKNLAFNLI